MNTMIKPKEIRLEWIIPDTAQDNPLNWRQHPAKQTDALEALIFGEDGVGWAGVGLINDRHIEDGWPEEKATPTLIDGHDRKKLAAKHGDPMPVIIGRWTPEQERLILATLDPLAAMAETNAEALDELLQAIQVNEPAVRKMLGDLAKMAGLHFGQDHGEGLSEDPGPQLDRVEELQKKWGTALGQLWEIPSLSLAGKSHWLLCGNSRDAKDVTRLMQGARAVLFATDPPYLVNYDGMNHPHKWNEPDKNKDWSDSYRDWDNAEQGEALYEEFISTAIEVAIDERAAWYCWHASRNQAMLEQVWKRHGAFVHQQIVWVKDRPVLTRSWYMWQHEPCFFGWIEGKKPKRIAENYPSTVWQIPTIAPGTSTDHPTTKPVELFTIPILQHTDPGDICYEPFAGSGSQYVAAEENERICYGLELEPGFVGVILERLSGLGLEPRLVE